MSLYRNLVWFIKGLNEYTQGGYINAARKFENDLERDCSKKEYMITGSNSGLGKETAMEIAKRGGTVHMVCRNSQYANDAKNEIVQVSNNENVYVHKLDLSNPVEILEFTTLFESKYAQNGLDVLINNAGCMINTREETSDNIEKNFATNTLGTYLLTESLIPTLLKRSSVTRPRVITVSSGGMLTNKLDPNDLQCRHKSFDGTMVYAQNKRQQVIITEKWSEKYPKIQFTSMHPGWVDTPAVQNSMPSFYNHMKKRLRTPKQGADTIVWLAVSNSFNALDPTMSGGFFQDRVSVPKHLPLAWSYSSQSDENSLMRQLEEFLERFNARRRFVKSQN